MKTNNLLGKVTPGITKAIRMDHAMIVATAHRFERTTSRSRKRAIVEACCTGLEVHTQLEDELFYPALREVAAANDALQKAPNEHAEMRRLIAELHTMQPDDERYDTVFMTLMRDLQHHIADEETLLLPLAELMLADRLDELGVAMARRRAEIGGPHAGEWLVNTARAMPAATMLMAGGLLAGGYLIGKAFEHRRHH